MWVRLSQVGPDFQKLLFLIDIDTPLQNSIFSIRKSQFQYLLKIFL